MKLHHVWLPACAIGAAALLVLPTQLRAYNTLGGSLGLDQRDFRIYDNFSDPTANDNTTPDPMFPGYTGATMAIWKGAIEWGSRLHGDGSGDPSQPNDLGSGGANFDSTFQGNATGVGNIDENIVSEINGSSGGIYAFTETVLPVGGGWRTRFYSFWTWADGPDINIPMGQTDIQGVATHEYGHALGLDHSLAPGATMQATFTGSGVSLRSISSDDIAGVRAIYGIALATKPVIASITASSCELVITGSNFALSGNEVWFTQAAAGGNGSPVVASNVASDGTTIHVIPPATAGSGDVLVHVPGSGNDKLSNAWPVAIIPAVPPHNYCSTSPNSFDPNGAIMGWSGSTHVADNNFTLIASGVPPNANGLFYYGHNQTLAAFGNGFRCVGSPVFRLAITPANVFGDTIFQLNFPALPGPINGGEVWNFQLWYRNPAGGGAGFNLSDGLQVTFCP